LSVNPLLAQLLQLTSNKGRRHARRHDNLPLNGVKGCTRDQGCITGRMNTNSLPIDEKTTEAEVVRQSTSGRAISGTYVLTASSGPAQTPQSLHTNARGVSQS
jgi:hypothetical protein